MKDAFLEYAMQNPGYFVGVSYDDECDMFIVNMTDLESDEGVTMMADGAMVEDICNEPGGHGGWKWNPGNFEKVLDLTRAKLDAKVGEACTGDLDEGEAEGADIQDTGGSGHVPEHRPWFRRKGEAHGDS